MEIDHIGYLSSNIEKSVIEFESLGYKCITDIIWDNIEHDGRPARNVKICFLSNKAVNIELVSPIDETSDVYNTLKRQGEGPYHICYQVNDLNYKIDELKRDSWLIIKKPESAIAFHNAKVAFLFKKGIGLIELVEKNNEGN